MSKVVNYNEYTENCDYPGVKNISPEAVLENINDIKLIDVRRPDEFTGTLAHIAGSELLTLELLPQKISELPKDITIVFICRSGNRSGQAAQFAQQNGFANVYNMTGGMISWNDKQFATEAE